jgi:hypothetical protein
MLAAAQVSPHEPCAVVRTVLSCAYVVVLTEGHCQEVLESCFSTVDARDTSRYRSGEKTLKVAKVLKALEVAEALKKIAELQRGTHHIRFAPGSGTEVILGVPEVPSAAELPAKALPGNPACTAGIAVAPIACLLPPLL